MLSALARTITEILDSKRAAYSFIATVFAAVLHLGFGVPPEGALEIFRFPGYLFWPLDIYSGVPTGINIQT